MAGKMFSQICDTELRLVCLWALLKAQCSIPPFSPDSDADAFCNLVANHMTSVNPAFHLQSKNSSTNLSSQVVIISLN